MCFDVHRTLEFFDEQSASTRQEVYKAEKLDERPDILQSGKKLYILSLDTFYVCACACACVCVCVCVCARTHVDVCLSVRVCVCL